jgi:hypothetical protein
MAGVLNRCTSPQQWEALPCAALPLAVCCPPYHISVQPRLDLDPFGLDWTTADKPLLLCPFYFAFTAVLSLPAVSLRNLRFPYPRNLRPSLPAQLAPFPTRATCAISRHDPTATTACVSPFALAPVPLARKIIVVWVWWDSGVILSLCC